MTRRMNVLSLSIALLPWLSACQHQAPKEKTEGSNYRNSVFFSVSDLPRLRGGSAANSINIKWWETNLEPGKTYSREIVGPGVITHIQVTTDPWNDPEVNRTLILKMYWDNETNPSVLSPIGDFFYAPFGGVGIRHANLLTSTLSGTFSCYFPMPFRKHARIEFENRSSKRLRTIAHQIDYVRLDELENNIGYFHAYWRRELPTKDGVPFTVCEAEGRGHFIGSNLQMQSLAGSFWFMEGNTHIYVDGEHRIEAVGTEDYFNGGWYFADGLYAGPYTGVTVRDEGMKRVAAYRFRIQDAVPFRKKLLVVNHHGEESAGQKSHADFCGVGYWYQEEPHKSYPDLPTRQGLLALRKEDLNKYPYSPGVK